MPEDELTKEERDLLKKMLWRIKRLRYEFCNNHYEYPNYVKIPRNMYDLLQCSQYFVLVAAGDTAIERIMGLEPCPTITIQTISEIEVF